MGPTQSIIFINIIVIVIIIIIQCFYSILAFSFVL